MKEYDYYKAELDRVETSGEFKAKIQITSPGGYITRHLDLNPESGEAIVDWLKERDLA